MTLNILAQRPSPRPLSTEVHSAFSWITAEQFERKFNEGWAVIRSDLAPRRPDQFFTIIDARGPVIINGITVTLKTIRLMDGLGLEGFNQMIRDGWNIYYSVKVYTNTEDSDSYFTMYKQE